jgi:hypothetical protein
LASESPDARGAPDEHPQPSGASFRKLCRSLLEEVKDYTHRKPLEGLLIAMIAGMVLSSLLRRER